MNREHYARLKDIVAEALARPDAERLSYLLARCGSDVEIRAEAESLLAAAVTAAPLFEQPTLLVAGGAVASETLHDIAAAAARPVLAAAGDDEGLPSLGTTRYAIRRHVGSGGMGIVYEVDDRLRNQVVALKTIRRRTALDVSRLKREFRSLEDVAHANLVSLYDLVVTPEQSFFTMEFVAGLPFVDFARREADRAEIANRLRRVLPQLIHGVQELHRRGLRHGDIKPSNVLVTAAERVVILDFGLTLGTLDPRGENEAIGTPAYLSPEQCVGDDASIASDWYAVGTMLYHALTGRPPFDGPVREVLQKKAREEAPPLPAYWSAAHADLTDLCAGLLGRAPESRWSGRAALLRLTGSASASHAGADDARDAPFVGRRDALALLAAAFDEMKAGRGSAVLIHGPSGIGKSTLVRRFIHHHLAFERVVVFSGRCHERESVPYNAFDGIIDAIARHLLALPRSEQAALLPVGISALGRLFPVLHPLCVDEDLAGDDLVSPRQRAVGAFRELITRLATRQPVVVDIDDFHWADADSVKWLLELLRPPSAPPFLLLLSFRSEEVLAKPFLRGLLERVDIGERWSIALGPLLPTEVETLVTALQASGDSRELARRAESIAKTSGGNPFLVEMLSNHHPLDAASTVPSLEEVLVRRLASLPEDWRVFLDALTVCGRPVHAARLFEACGFAGDERPLVARLRTARFVRSSRVVEHIEVYHDRIRETLAARVSPNAARRLHAAMAEVLLSHGDHDPEALLEHFRGAGNVERAATYAVAAAEKAAEVLAFDLAATFYRQAIALQLDSPSRGSWTAALARTLENAGRPVEAAGAYLDAGAKTSGPEQIRYRRQAAELYLIGGQIDHGLALIDDVLRRVGVRLAGGPRRAIVSLLVHRLQLRWRGLKFDQREGAAIPAADLLRIDACWAISAGLAMVDPIRAADVNVRMLLRALDAGDAYRIARAMALEAGFAVVGIGAGMDRSRAFSRNAEVLAARGSFAYVTGLALAWEGIAAFLTGEWQKASDRCGRGATILREECTGVTWELNMAHNFFLGGLVAQGELREVARLLPGLLQGARERGNFYLELELNTRMILVWLAADEADDAERRGNEGIARWSHRGFQRQHYSHLLMRVQIELYRGRVDEAWRLMEACRRQSRQNLFLRVQHTRIESANYYARCAVAMAAGGRDPRQMRHIASREAARLMRQRRPWATAFGWLLRATIAYQEGATARAIAALRYADDGFRSAGMRLYSSVCRRRLGALTGGESGDALRAESDAWMVSQDIRDRDAMTRLIAPGLPD